MATLTSANCTLMIGVGLVFPVPQEIQGFATDDAVAIDANQPAEALMGVDGIMSAGWVPTMRVQTISLQADSPSLFIFETWATSQEAAREVFFANGSLYIPSINRKYAMTRGVLTDYRTHPDAKRILQPVQFKITWQTVAPALM